MHGGIGTEALEQRTHLARRAVGGNGVDRHRDAGPRTFAHEALHVGHARCVFARNRDDEVRFDTACAQGRAA